MFQTIFSDTYYETKKQHKLIHHSEVGVQLTQHVFGRCSLIRSTATRDRIQQEKQKMAFSVNQC